MCECVNVCMRYVRMHNHTCVRMNECICIYPAKCGANTSWPACVCMLIFMYDTCINIFIVMYICVCAFVALIPFLYLCKWKDSAKMRGWRREDFSWILKECGFVRFDWNIIRKRTLSPLCLLFLGGPVDTQIPQITSSALCLSMQIWYTRIYIYTYICTYVYWYVYFHVYAHRLCVCSNGLCV